MSPQGFIEMRKESLLSEYVLLPSDQGHLEGWLAYDAEATRCDGVLLLSPHPNFAGTMDNNVIRELAASLSASGFIVLRFNYPGIGASRLLVPEGISVLDYWDTVEREQRFDEAIRPSLTALRFLESSLGGFIDRTHLVGYSYGAMIALLMAEQLAHIHSVAAISLPWISRYPYHFLGEVRCRKYFITGKQDFAFEAQVYEQAWPQVAEPKRFKWLNCDHFFRGHEKEVAQEVLQFLLNKGGDVQPSWEES
jgi:alpha/beta superfamily hydrolase